MAEALDRVLAPGTEAEAAEAVAAAAAEGRSLRIEGGGSRAGFGRPVTADQVISTAGLGGVALYEPSALTLVAGAGAPLDEIETALAAERQRLPFEPADLRALYGTEGARPTLGGMVASAASGPRRIQAGACRDSLIGARFVDGTGRTIKNGGRVMKNVTGYDLLKLLAGSHGTLGLMTQVAFKLQPIPETQRVLRLSGLDDARAVAALSAALGSPFDVTGAAHAPAGPGGAPVTMIRLEGFETSVAYRAAELSALLAGFGPAEIETAEDRAAADWAWVRDAAMFAGTDEIVWRCSVKPTDGPKLVAALPDLAPRALYDWGGGLVWLGIDPGAPGAGAAAIRGAVDALGGHATLMRARQAIRAAAEVFHPEPAPLALLSAGIRLQFDPRGVLNPGRMRAV